MKRYLPFLLYALVVLVVFGRALLLSAGQTLFADDGLRVYFFQRSFFVQSLEHWHVPLWNPYLLSGTPFLEHPQTYLWYPVSWLLLLFPTNYFFSLHIALHLGIAMIAMYVLVRRWTGVLPAWIAGVSYGLSTFFTSRIWAGHMFIIAPAAWLPLVVRFYWDALVSRGRTRLRSSIIAAIFLALELLSGNQAVSVFTAEILFAVTVLESYWSTSLRPMAWLLFTLFLGGSIAAVSIIPNSEFMAQSIRTVSVPYEWTLVGTPTVAHLLELIHPFFFYKILPETGFGFERAAYIGFLPLIMAISVVIHALYQKSKRKEIFLFAGLAAIGIWISLARNSAIDIYHLLWRFAPLYQQMRVSARHMIIYAVSISVLFGIGVSYIRNTFMRCVIVVILLVELVPIAWMNIHVTSLPIVRDDKELVGIFSHMGLYRMLPLANHGDALKDTIEFDASSHYGFFSASGYDVPPLRNYWQFVAAMNNFDRSQTVFFTETIPPFSNITSPYLNFLNVKYILVPTAGDTIKGISSGQFVAVKENISRGWKLYENKNVIPRFFIATTMQKETNKEAVLSRIKQGSVDPKTTIIVDGSSVDTSGFAPDCPAGYQGNVSVTSYDYERIVLTSSNPCNAFLATSEVMYPGWTATIDGKEVKVFEGNAAFRTLYLPAGPHTIVFSYRPMIVLLGALISLVTIVIIIFFMFR